MGVSSLPWSGPDEFRPISVYSTFTMPVASACEAKDQSHFGGVMY